MAQKTQEDIVSDVARNLLITPLSTLSLDTLPVRLLRPAVSHADWHQGLPWPAVAELFRHLPVLDLFRLGHLFTPRWLEVWRMDPLFLHDRQLTDAIPRSEVADAITYLLEEYVDGDGDGGVGNGAEDHGRVESFRVESTEWSLDHAARWCALLRKGEALEVVLFNRCFPGQGRPPMLIHVPRRLLDCTTVRILHLGFFTVEAGELDALTATTDLGLHGCACRAGVVEGVVAACRDLQNLSVQDGAMDGSVVVRSAHRLRGLSMLHTVSSSLTVDDAPTLLDLLPGFTRALSISRAPALRDLSMLHNVSSSLAVDDAPALLELNPGSTRKLSISRAPALRNLLRLNLPDTTLQIDGTEIKVDMQQAVELQMPSDVEIDGAESEQKRQPQMPSVEELCLALDYTELRGKARHMVPRVVGQILMCFPFVTRLTIERKDAVPPEEGMASRHDAHTHGHLNLFDGVQDVAQRLRTLTLSEFRGGKAELALLRALMDNAKPLEDVGFRVHSLGSGVAYALGEAHAALQEFAAST